MNNVNMFITKKRNGEKITILTSYDYLLTKLIDKSGVDAILVGDSLGMVVLGYEDTTKVTIDDMIHHIKAVVRGAKNSYIIGDMPFLSYHTGIYDSVKNAGRLVQEGGCKAVKMEGGIEIVDSLKAIINAGIPVMGHLGYTPQSVNVFGGHKSQGKTIETAAKIMKDALLLQEAGVFAIVLECVPYKVAEFVSKRLDIPTIGIGSGSGCDGQVLVTHDMIGFDEEFKPKHAKQYVNISSMIREAVNSYINEVKNGDFPEYKNSYIVDDSVMVELEKLNKE